MATHLDLEEQEQLDQLKHFWNKYGTLITWVVLLVAGAVVAWNGWQFYQRNQAAQAAALYDTLEQAVQAGDADRVERAFGDVKSRFARTAYAQQAGLLRIGGAGKAALDVAEGTFDAVRIAGLHRLFQRVVERRRLRRLVALVELPAVPSHHSAGNEQHDPGDQRAVLVPEVLELV